MKKKSVFAKLSEEQKSLLCFGTALVILLAVVIFGVTPLLEAAILAKGKALECEGKLWAYKRYSEIKNVQKLEEQENLKLQALELRLPSNLKQEDLIEELYSKAERFNVKVSGLKQAGASKNKELALFLQSKGKYQDVLKFLEAVEQEGSLKILREVVVKGDEAGENLELAAVVTAYKN